MNKMKEKKFTFKCTKCKKVHEMNTYAIAQIAMGNSIIFTCDCGKKIKLCN